MTYLSRCAFLIILVSPFGVANTLLDELSICAKNNDSSQRLVCYDTLAKKTISSQPKQLKLPQQIPSQAVTHKPVDNAIRPCVFGGVQGGNLDRSTDSALQ